MPKYVQGKDGRFAGSIGDGKREIPTASDVPPVVEEAELPPPLYDQAAEVLYEKFTEWLDDDDEPST